MQAIHPVVQILQVVASQQQRTALTRADESCRYWGSGGTLHKQSQTAWHVAGA